MSKKILISDFAQISCVEFLGPKYIKFWVSSKSESKNFFDPKGGPFYVKKIFVLDFSKILHVRFQGHKDKKFWVSSKLESKILFDSKGGPFYFKTKILSPILLKLCVSDPETISISNFNFYPHRTQFFSADPKGGPFYVKKIFVSDFSKILHVRS